MGKYWICICLAWGLGIGGCTPVQQYRYTEGKIYGTFYHISYASDEDLKEEILRQMESVNASLSMFNPESDYCPSESATRRIVQMLCFRKCMRWLCK